MEAPTPACRVEQGEGHTKGQCGHWLDEVLCSASYRSLVVGEIRQYSRFFSPFVKFMLLSLARDLCLTDSTKLSMSSTNMLTRTRLKFVLPRPTSHFPCFELCLFPHSLNRYLEFHLHFCSLTKSWHSHLGGAIVTVDRSR